MKALTAKEIWIDQMGGDEQYVSLRDALTAMERFRDQDVTILRHLFQQKISDATEAALKEGMRLGRQELADYGKRPNRD